MTIIFIGDTNNPSQSMPTDTQLDLLNLQVITDELAPHTRTHTQTINQLMPPIDHIYKNKIARLQTTIMILSAIWTLSTLPISIAVFHHDFTNLLMCFMSWGSIESLLLNRYTLNMQALNTQWSETISPAALGL